MLAVLLARPQLDDDGGLSGVAGVGVGLERSSTSMTGGGTLRSMAAMLRPSDEEGATPPWSAKGAPPREWRVESAPAEGGAVRTALDEAAGS